MTPPVHARASDPWREIEPPVPLAMPAAAPEAQVLLAAMAERYARART